METVVSPALVPLGVRGAEGSSERTGEKLPSPIISIIVPCWRDDGVSAEVAAEWLQHPQVREVLVASVIGMGDSSPVSSNVRVVRCTRAGRGCQMNEAARVAFGDVLLFQHADTELTNEHLCSLHRLMQSAAVGGGAFRRRFDERHPRLRWLEPWEALRCRVFGPVFGDQSIFVRRSVFEAMGGFADVPLMEDVEFSCRLRRRGGLVILAPAIGSSARKHLEQGCWRTTLTNAVLLALYVFRVSPHRLHGWYYRHRAQRPVKP